MPQYPRAVNYRPAPRGGSLVPARSRVCYRFVTTGCLDEVATPSLIYFQGGVERSTKLQLADPLCVSRTKRLMITLTAGGELVARQVRQRIRCGWALASQGSDAHTVDHLVLLQTPAAATADIGVKLSAEPSRVVTGIRSVTHSHGVRVRCRRSAPGPMAKRGTSQRGPERTNRREPIEKPRRRRSSSSASPLSRGVTTPDLPEGI
jgi:hypothetical protein